MPFRNLKTLSPWFWELIEQGERDDQKMEGILEKLSREELERFAHEFEWAIIEMSGATFRKIHGDSEDIVQDVAGWIASQGRQHYADIYDNPQLFPNIDEIDISRANFTGLAEAIYERRWGEELPGSSHG